MQEDIEGVKRQEKTFWETLPGKIFLEEFTSILSDCYSTSLWLEQECLTHEVLSEKYYPAIHEDTSALIQMLMKLRQNNYTGFIQSLLSYVPATLGQARKFENPRWLDHIKFLRTRNKDAIKELQSKYVYISSDIIIRELERVAGIQKTMLLLLERYHELFREEKKKANLVDFSDLEHLALQALVKENTFSYTDYSFEKTEYANQLTRELNEIYVDEYQDTNLLQDTILRAVSKENNRFMVGDPKQSIYAFRGAMPALFRRYQKLFPRFEENASTPAYRIFLTDNFRSDSSIIDFTNGICSVMMNTDPCDPMYTAEDALICGKKTDTCHNVIVSVFDLQQRSGDDQEEAVSNPESSYIAHEIASILSSGAYTADQIAILARNNATLEKVDAALKELSIPTSTQLDAPFFKQKEIITALSFLHAIDNPCRDIYLLGIMNSPIFGFTADELFSIRQGKTQDAYYTSLVNMAETSTSLGNKCAAFVQTLQTLRKSARELTSDALLWKLYTEYHFFALFPTRMAGDNLRFLHTLARNGEATAFNGLHGFLRILNRMMEKGDSCAIPSGKSGFQGVRLMTIHGSKGLEFPVVFLAGAAGLYNTESQNSKAIFSPSLGCTFSLPSESGYSKVNTCIRKAARMESAQSMSKEEMRVLYVAFTRAKERLYITASPRSLPALLRRTMPDSISYSHKVLDKSRQIQTANSYLDLIFLSLSQDPGFKQWILSYPTENPSNRYQFTSQPVTIYFNPAKKEDQTDESFYLFEQKILDFSRKSIKKALGFQYPYQGTTKIPKKISVSQLNSGRYTVDEILLPSPLRTPTFVRENRDDGRSYGTAMHWFMQFCNFHRCTTMGVREEAADLVARGFMNKQDAGKLNFFALTQFFISSKYKEIEKSTDVNREMRFNMLVYPRELPDDKIQAIASDEQLLVQGVIDCFYLNEQGTYTVLDFKSDHVQNEQELIERYQDQLLIYARAVKAITGIPATLAYIYSFYLGKWIPVSMDQ